MKWVGSELVDVTQAVQENNLAKMKMDEFRYRCAICKKLFSCEAGWKEHKEWMQTCGRTTCVCDIFSYGKYVHSVSAWGTNKPYQRTMEKNELRKIEAMIDTTMKKPESIEPEKLKTMLETKRDIQRDDSISFIDKSKE